MYRRFCFLILFSACMLFAAAPATAADGEKEQDQLKLLKGTWKVTAFERDGENVPLEKAKTLKGASSKWTFQEVSSSKLDGSCTWEPDGGLGITWGMKLDASKKPKQMTLYLFALEDWKAIYELDGDKLRIAYGGKRPENFKTTKGDGGTVVTLEREKKK